MSCCFGSLGHGFLLGSVALGSSVPWIVGSFLVPWLLVLRSLADLALSSGNSGSLRVTSAHFGSLRVTSADFGSHWVTSGAFITLLVTSGHFGQPRVTSVHLGLFLVTGKPCPVVGPLRVTSGHFRSLRALGHFGSLRVTSDHFGQLRVTSGNFGPLRLTLQISAYFRSLRVTSGSVRSQFGSRYQPPWPGHRYLEYRS